MSAQRSLLLAAAACLMLAACSQSPLDRAAEHTRKARQFATRKDYRKAAIEYKIASQNLPRDAEPLYGLAMVYQEAGAGPLAIETLQQALRVNPQHEAAQLQLATIQVFSAHAEAVEDARQTLRRHTANHPDDADATGTLAQAEAKLGNHAEARRLLGVALRLNPENMRPAALLVARYTAQGQLAPATGIARAVEAQMPNSPEGALLSAQVAAAGKDMAGAEKQLRRALTLQPEFGPALEMLMRKKLLDRDMPAAEQTAQALSRLPEKKWWPVYGRLLFGERKIGPGIAEFKRVIAEHPDNVELRNEYAALLLASGRRDEASASLQSTLGGFAGDSVALTQRAALEIENGNLEAAGRDIERLREMKVRTGELSYQESRIFAARGETVAQGNLLSETLRLNPQLLLARLALARVLTGAGKSKGALAVLDAATELDKQTAEFAFHRNAALLAGHDWAEARKGVDAALAGSGLPGFLYQDALLRAHEHDLAGARKSLEAVLAVAPADPAALTLLGEVMRRQGDDGRYLALLRNAAERSPKAADVNLLLGEELIKRRDRTGARAAFERARAGDPVRAGSAIALLDIEAGAYDTARQRLLALVKTGDAAQVRLLLAQIETGPGGSEDAAMQHYARAIELEPSNVPALNNLANLLARTGKLDDARFWAEKALALAPDSPVIADSVGWIYYRLGQVQAALPHLQKSLRLQDRPVAHYHLAAALLKAGGVSAARQEYAIALGQDPGSPERPVVDPLFAARSPR